MYTSPQRCYPADRPLACVLVSRAGQLTLSANDMQSCYEQDKYFLCGAAEELMGKVRPVTVSGEAV